LTALIFPLWLALILALGLSVAVYAFLILRLHCFAGSQLLDLPMGRTLYGISKKLDR